MWPAEQSATLLETASAEPQYGRLIASKNKEYVDKSINRWNPGPHFWKDFWKGDVKEKNVQLDNLVDIDLYQRKVTSRKSDGYLMKWSIKDSVDYFYIYIDAFIRNMGEYQIKLQKIAQQMYDIWLSLRLWLLNRDPEIKDKTKELINLERQFKNHFSGMEEAVIRAEREGREFEAQRTNRLKAELETLEKERASQASAAAAELEAERAASAAASAAALKAKSEMKAAFDRVVEEERNQASRAKMEMKAKLEAEMAVSEAAAELEAERAATTKLKAERTELEAERAKLEAALKAERVATAKLKAERTKLEAALEAETDYKKYSCDIPIPSVSEQVKNNMAGSELAGVPQDEVTDLIIALDDADINNCMRVKKIVDDYLNVLWEQGEYSDFYNNQEDFKKEMKKKLFNIVDEDEYVDFVST